MREIVREFCLVCLILLPVFAAGCTSSTPVPRGRDVIFAIAGVGGDGPEYDALGRGLRSGGINQAFVTVDWGAPKPLFMLNFSDPDIHRDAEEMLAEKIIEARHAAPKSRIDLIGHSAGAGVAIGALEAPAAGDSREYGCAARAVVLAEV